MSENAGIFMQAFGAGSSAMATRQAGQYNRQVADYNTSVAEYQATDAVARGELGVNKHLKATQQLIGAQRASLAAQGVDVNSGSSLELQADAAYQGAADAVTIRTNAAREAWGYRVQAANSSMHGQIAESTANSKAFSTILGAGADIALKRFGFSSKTAPTYNTGGYSGSSWSGNG